MWWERVRRGVEVREVEVRGKRRITPVSSPVRRREGGEGGIRREDIPG